MSSGFAINEKNTHLVGWMLFLVGILGLEPRMTGPESVVLPLHHIPISFAIILFPDCDCKGTHFF